MVIWLDRFKKIPGRILKAGIQKDISCFSQCFWTTLGWLVTLIKSAYELISRPWTDLEDIFQKGKYKVFFPLPGTVSKPTLTNLPPTASQTVLQLLHVRTTLSFSPSRLQPQFGHMVAIKVSCYRGLSSISGSKTSHPPGMVAISWFVTASKTLFPSTCMGKYIRLNASPM